MKAEQLASKPFSLRALAAETGIPRSTLGEWFSGRRLPSVGGLYQFAGGLGATAGEQAELRQVRDRLDTEKRLSLDLEHYTLRALESLELRESVDVRSRLAVSHALLRAGEQRLTTTPS
ncbi:helix-turn-helix domain-containing protein [Kribbella sp. NPDC002412]